MIHDQAPFICDNFKEALYCVLSKTDLCFNLPLGRANFVKIVSDDTFLLQPYKHTIL